MNTIENGETPSGTKPELSTLQRRSVLTGAVWSMPVVALAVAAPASAASLGVITFAQPTYTTTAGSTFPTISGTVSGGTSLPAVVSISYPAGFTGPATAVVDPTTGAFQLAGVVASALVVTGQPLVATAIGFTAGTTLLSTTAVLGPVIPPAGPALVWGYITMNGTGRSNRNYAATPTFPVSAGYTSYIDVAQVGDEVTYIIPAGGTSLVGFAGAAGTKRTYSVALNPGETLAALAGGPQVIAVLTSAGRVFTGHYGELNLDLAHMRNPAGVTFTQIAHFWSDVAGTVALSSDGYVYVLDSAFGPNVAPTRVKDMNGSDLSGVVEISAGMNPRITARKADGTVWSVRALSGTSNLNVLDRASQVWDQAEGIPLLAKSLVIHSSPYTDSSYTTAALGVDGMVRVWGERPYYVVSGASATAKFAVKIDVLGQLAASGVNVAGVSISNLSQSAPLFAVLSDGRVASWGNPGDEGERGDGTSTVRYTPKLVVDANGAPITGVNRVATTRGGGWAILA